MVVDFQYSLSKDVKVTAYPVQVDDKVNNETIDDNKKRSGKQKCQEASEAGDNLIGDLRSAEMKDGEPVFKKDYAVIDTSKVDKSVQQKFVGVKKEDIVEFELDKAFTDKNVLSEFLGESE